MKLFQSALLLLLLFALAGSCRQDQVIDEITLLTNDSSKLWILYEHNFVTGDNSKFVNRPPYVFLTIYEATHLRLDKDLSFSLGDKNSMQYFGNWLFLPSERVFYLSSVDQNKDIPKDITLESNLGYSVMKLSPRQLIIRKDAPQGSFLPYYEYRFKSD